MVGAAGAGQGERVQPGPRQVLCEAGRGGVRSIIGDHVEDILLQRAVFSQKVGLVDNRLRHLATIDRSWRREEDLGEEIFL